MAGISRSKDTLSGSPHPAKPDICHGTANGHLSISCLTCRISGVHVEPLRRLAERGELAGGAPLKGFGPYVAAPVGEGAIFTADLPGGTGVVAAEGRGARLLYRGEGWRVISHPVWCGAAVFYGERASCGERSGVSALLRSGEDGVAVLAGRAQGFDRIGPLGPTARDGRIAFLGEVEGRACVAGCAAAGGGVRILARAGEGIARFHGIPVALGGGAIFRADLSDGRAAVCMADPDGVRVLLAAGDRLPGGTVEEIGRFPGGAWIGGPVAVVAVVAAGGSVVVRLDGAGARRLALPAGIGAIRGALLDDAGAAWVYATPPGGSLAVYHLPSPVWTDDPSDLGDAPRRIVGIGDVVEGGEVRDLALNPASIAVGRAVIRLGLSGGQERIVLARPGARPG